MRRNKSIKDILSVLIKNIELDKHNESGITSTLNFEGKTFQVNNQHNRYMLEVLLRSNGTNNCKIRYYE